MQFIYLFDPLCGWCYGASPAIRELSKSFKIQALATGLFASPTPMTSEFADYIWQSDKRLEALTGLPSSDIYRQNVLINGAKNHATLSSQALSLAMNLVKEKYPNQFFDILSAFQMARYVDGLDTSDSQMVKNILKNQGLTDIADNFESEQNIANTNAWLNEGQTLANQLGVRGVPQLFVQIDEKLTHIPSEMLFQDTQNIEQNIKKFLKI